MTKRQSSGDEPGSKRQRTAAGLTPEVEAELEQLNKGLEDIDRQCAKAQLQVERDFESKKAPLYGKRDAILEEKGLWGTIICSHPALQAFLTPPEEKVLVENLVSVKVEDNIDDRGSYSVTFTFNKEAEQIFTPIVWTRKTVFNEDGDQVDSGADCTKITWKTKEEDPRELIKKMEKSDEQEEPEMCVVLEWFEGSNDIVSCSVFGEPLRQEIYPKLSVGDYDQGSSSEEEDAE